MKTLLIVVISVICNLAAAATGDGTSRYNTVGFPGEAPSGFLAIRGQAADVIFSEMTAIQTEPEVPNLKELDPNKVTLQMLERKYGQSVSCFNRPEIDGGKWKLDAAGAVIRVMTCVLNFSDATTGTIKP